MPIKFYFDVHVDKAIHDQLRLRGVDVLRAQDDNTAEMEDEQLSQSATEVGRIIFTKGKWKMTNIHQGELCARLVPINRDSTLPCPPSSWRKAARRSPDLR